MQEYEGIVKSIMAFRIPNGLPKVNILLFGGVGAGKSSLISTVDSLFKGRMSRRAPHGQGSRSFTRTLTKYSFSISLGSGIAFSIHSPSDPAAVHFGSLVLASHVASRGAPEAAG